MREVTKQSIVSLAVTAAAALAMACGGHQAASPTAPSVAPSATAVPAPTALAGATITGTVVGTATSLPAGRITAFGTAVTVIVTGTTASATVDGSGHFTLQNVPAGHVDLHFIGNGVDAHLGLDDVVEHASITITVVVNGSTAELDHGQREGPDTRVEVEGLVTSTSASTITVNGKTITVGPATIIVHGDKTVLFASIKRGDRVEVKGTSTTTGGLTTILATKIEVQNVASPPVVTAPTPTPPTTGDDDDDADDDKNEVEVRGAIAGKTGTCKAISFTIGTTSVTTSEKTEFKDAACGTLVNGTKVEVKGTKQASGVVLARRVKADK